MASEVATRRGRPAPLSPRFLDQIGSFGLPLLLIAFVVFFSLMRPDSFGTILNLKTILNAQTIVILAAFGVMIPLILGEFDLSVASNAALANILVVGLAERQGLDPALAIALTLSAAVTVGLVNGLVVTRLKVNAFVGTLGMATVLAGIGLLYTGSSDILSAPEGLTNVSRATFLGLKLPIYYTAVVAVVLIVVLAYLPAGRKMFALGANRRAAELNGIPANRYLIGGFMAAGLLGGLAGVVQGASLGSASNATSVDLLLPAFAAAFLGATTIQPGRYNVVGTILAAYFLDVTIRGLQDLGAAAWVQPTFNGTVLVLAVALSGWASRARARNARSEQLAAMERGLEAETTQIDNDGRRTITR